MEDIDSGIGKQKVLKIALAPKIKNLIEGNPFSVECIVECLHWLSHWHEHLTLASDNRDLQIKVSL